MKEYNVITLHRLDKDHEMQWDNVKILDKECNYFKRLWSEKLHINSTKDTLNVQHDTRNLSNIYNLILTQQTSYIKPYVQENAEERT